MHTKESNHTAGLMYIQRALQSFEKVGNSEWEMGRCLYYMALCFGYYGSAVSQRHAQIRNHHLIRYPTDYQQHQQHHISGFAGSESSQETQYSVYSYAPPDLQYSIEYYSLYLHPVTSHTPQEVYGSELQINEEQA